MKTGLTLPELATTLAQHRRDARDFVAPTNLLMMSEDASALLNLGPEAGSSFELAARAHRQIGSRLQVPALFYDRLRDKHPDLLAHTVNELFRREPERRMVRTLGGTARAFLSARYRRFDNWQVAEAVLPELAGIPDMRIDSSQVTDERLYIKAVFPRLIGEVRVGDVVQAGLIISNSEVGSGSTKVEPLVYRLVCKNGMIAGDLALGRHHVGRDAGGDEEESREVFSDETRQADDRAFALKLRDTVRASATEAVFLRTLEGMQRAAGQPIAGRSLQQVVEQLAGAAQLNEAESGSVLEHLIGGGDLSRYGLLNAVTATAQGVESYDRSVELERLGGRLATDEALWATVAASN